MAIGDDSSGLQGIWLFDRSRNWRIAVGNRDDGLSYLEHYTPEGNAKFIIHTARDDAFSSYVYQTPGESAWSAVSDFMTAAGVIKGLLNLSR